MTRIEAVVSDFGGVLTTPLMDAFAGLQDAQGIPLEAIGKGLVLAAERDGGLNPLYELEKGAITEGQFAQKLGDALREVLGRDVELQSFGEAFFAHLHPNEELFAFMRGLHGRGYRMAILTNNVREWEPLWRSMLPIDEIFDIVVDSGFVGLRKPDPAIYHLMLERLELAPEATVFVDDLEINCAAAEALGMRTVHFRSTAQTIAELEQLLDGDGPASAPAASDAAG